MYNIRPQWLKTMTRKCTVNRWCFFIALGNDSTIMTSSNGNIFRVTGPLCGNSPVPVNSPHKGQWHWALMFSLICAWINDWVNNREAGDLRRHRGHYDVTVMTVVHHRWSKFEIVIVWISKNKQYGLLRDSIIAVTSHEPHGVSNHWRLD